MAATVRRLDGPSPVPAGAYDLTALGYAEEEFVLEGTAHSYEIAGERGEDGRWEATPAARAPFVTRMLVRRPADATRFSGTVAVEWFNVSGGLDAGPDWTLLHREVIRRGHAWVGVSAQKAGIDGGGLVEGMHLKQGFPDRYGVLAHPGDAWSFDMFTQAGAALRGGDGGRLLGGLDPARVIALGESQSAAFLVTYVNAVDPLVTVFDGFLVHGRGGAGAALDGFNLRASDDLETTARTIAGRGERIRDDVRVPVLVLQSETDVALLGGGRADQADGPNLRQWEIAGAAHADTYILIAGAEDDGRLPPARLAERLRPTTDVLGFTTGTPINAGPQQHYVGQAAFAHLERWVAGGDPAAAAPRLRADSDGRDFVRDGHGIAVGGVRTPWVDVPVATTSGLGQTGEVFSILFGTTEPFDAATLARLYPGGRADYVERFAASLDQTIAAGFLLEADRAEMLAVAEASYPASG
jgi:hypothetical protein